MSFFDEGNAFITMIPMFPSASSLGSLRDQIAPADQVVGRGAEGEDPIDEAAAAVPQLAKQRDGLQPAKRLLNQRALALTDPIPGVSGRARVDSAAAVAELVLRHVRRDAHASDGGDPGADVVRFVGGHREAPRGQRQLPQHDNGRIAFGRAAGRRDRRVDDQAVAILGEHVRQIPKFRFSADRFLVQRKTLLATLRFVVARVDSVAPAVTVVSTLLPDVIVVRARDVAPLQRAAWPHDVPVVTVTAELQENARLSTRFAQPFARLDRRVNVPLVVT